MVTEATAKKIADHYQEINNKANAAQDEKLLATVEAGPARTAEQRGPGLRQGRRHLQDGAAPVGRRRAPAEAGRRPRHEAGRERQEDVSAEQHRGRGQRQSVYALRTSDGGVLALFPAAHEQESLLKEADVFEGQGLAELTPKAARITAVD
ncbi:hypothetical protein KEF29_41055 [Streptomyces tuirus]|uniref:DUF8094 domain-containing protein n=1 Tax=Streptomyces tuirus TaxID=68278 RepID=A0A941FFA7_9ACTN|nr:hypothetical protein [Streptomyces tuirus]